LIRRFPHNNPSTHICDGTVIARRLKLLAAVLSDEAIPDAQAPHLNIWIAASFIPAAGRNDLLAMTLK